MILFTRWCDIVVMAITVMAAVLAIYLFLRLVVRLYMAVVIRIAGRNDERGIK